MSLQSCYSHMMRCGLVVAVGLLGCSTVQGAPRDTSAAVAAREMGGLWILQIRRQAWKPRDLEFILRIEPDGTGTAAVDPVFIGRTAAGLVEFAADGDRVRFSLHSWMDDIHYEFEGRRSGGTLDGVVRWNDGHRDQAEPFTGFQREVRRFDLDLDRFPVEEDPRRVGIEPVLLDRLLLGAETARSDALIVVASGKLVAARTFGSGDAPTSVGSLSGAIAQLAGGPGDVATGLRPSDLAALGQALVDGGDWTGEPVVPGRWIEALALPPVDTTSVSATPWTVQADPTDPDPGAHGRSPLGYGHVTADGEGLLIYPAAELVVVRTMRRVENRYDARYGDRDEMEWLDEMSEAIAVDTLGRKRHDK